MMIVRPWQRFNSTFRSVGKFVLILLASILLLLFYFSATAYTEIEENAVSLTAEEQAWIDAHPVIRLAVNHHYEPRAYLDKNGILKGISVEYARLFEKKLGLKIELVGSTWQTALDRAFKYEVDGIMNAAELEERRRYLNFTDIYVASPQAVLANEREPMISGLDTFCGRKMGVTRKTSQNNYLRDNFPCIERVEIASVEDGLTALSTGRVDAVFGNFDVLITKSREMLLVNLKAIYLEYMPPTGFARIGVRKDEPLLLSLLNKTIASITKEERDQILAKWYGAEIPPLPSDLKQQEKLDLSPEEQAWLAQDPTVHVSVVDFPPFIIVEEGQKPTGISIDYLNLIADRTGIKLKYIVSTRPLTEDLKSMQNHKGPDLITSIMRTPDREKTFLFSKDYLSIPRVIFTRTHGQFISGMNDLTGKTIAVPEGTLIQKQIQERYPQIKLLPFDTDLESLEAIATDGADAYVGNLTHASYLIERRGLSNLKVAAPSLFGDHVFSFGSRKDWPELSSIINKGLDSITPEEKTAIRSKHIKLIYEHGIKPGDIFKWILIVAGSALLILILFMLWNKNLAKQVRVRTSELTTSNKLLETEIVERKQVEESLQQSKNFNQSTLDSLQYHIAVLDREGSILSVNESWRRFARENGGGSLDRIGTGINYLEICRRSSDLGDELALNAFKGIQSVLAGTQEQFGLEYRCHSPVEKRWFLMRVNPSSGLKGGVIISHADITERKLAEINLYNAYTKIEQLKNKLAAETAYLQEEIKLEHDFESIIGNSPVIQHVLFKVKQVATTDTTVLVLGETGTGKELVARAIHNRSLRKQHPLVKVNCAALPASLIESELFGHEPGAFTGAQARQIGRFEIANGTSIFLDEIGELPVELQTKLLQVLQDGEFERLGSSNTIKVDVRVIAATNRNLEDQVRKGTFREDLFYRLNVFPLTVPPLRERVDDIPLLAEFFMEKAAKRLGKSIEPAHKLKIDQNKLQNCRSNILNLVNVL